jgi:hypothetical protein
MYHALEPVQPFCQLRPTLKISGEHKMDDLDTLLISSAGS